MARFYCPQPLTVGDMLVLPEAVTHHVQVLRLEAGSRIALFNGSGGSFSAVLTEISRRQVRVRIEAFDAGEVELPYRLTLAQALPEASKMDWIVEKAVELGAAAIQPLAAQRSVVRLSAEREVKKRAHWQAIVIAASEQSGRNRLAEVEPLADMRRWMAQPRPAACLLLSPRAATSISTWAGSRAPQDVTLVVGPEGGFTRDEEDLAIASGATPVGMGARILRTETAGLAAIAALNALWGAV